MTELRNTGWIREEFRAAAERSRSLPSWARPTVTRPMTRPSPSPDATHPPTNRSDR